MSTSRTLEEPTPARARTLAGLIVLVVASLLAACSSAAPTAAGDLWQVLSLERTEEADPPQDDAELVRRSSVVVTGTVLRVEPGPETVRTFPEGTSVEHSAIVVVKVGEVLKGTWEESTVPVHMFSAGPVEEGSVTLPVEDGVWFLEPSGIEDYYMTVASAGLWMEDGGAVSTVRDPVQTEVVVPEGVDSIEDAARAISRQVAAQA